jgi:hypothetical protein
MVPLTRALLDDTLRAGCPPAHPFAHTLPAGKAPLLFRPPCHQEAATAVFYNGDGMLALLCLACGRHFASIVVGETLPVIPPDPDDALTAVAVPT